LAVKVDWQGKNKFCVCVDLAHPLGYLNELMPPRPWQKLPVIGACVMTLLALGVWWKRGWTKVVLGKIAEVVGYTVILFVGIYALGSIRGSFDIPAALADSSPDWVNFMGRSQSSGIRQQTTYATPTHPSRIPLYITAWSENAERNKAVLEGMTRSLRSTERVDVFTDAEGRMSNDVFEANLWYTDDSLFIELYDAEGAFLKLVEYYKSPPNSAQLNVSYQRLASRIVTKIEKSNSWLARHGKSEPTPETPKAIWH
jgi:hypothetical protein